jgi:hypothetical protein
VIVSYIDSRNIEDSAAAISAAGHETVMVMPCIDEEMAKRSAGMMASRAGASGLILCIADVEREGFIALTNRAFRASSSMYFGYVAQDAFAGRHWLGTALKAMRLPERGLFAFNDGKWMGMLASFGLASRAWAIKNYDGNFFFPGYVSHYADAELSVLAMNDRRYCYDANSVLIEVDWNKEQSRVNPEDKALYKSRSVNGFHGRVQSQELRKLFS